MSGILRASLPEQASQWIEREADRLVGEWQDACRIPSVSSESLAQVERMASWLAQRAAPLFDRFERLPTKAGPPVLAGLLAGTGPQTLMFYSHYDVVAAGAGWTTGPFDGELRAGALFARGAGDDKADVMARLHAIEAVRATRGPLPFSILWVSEGMEEVGSPGLAEVLAEHRELLRADACLWESYYRTIDGRAAAIGFGSRGVLNVELSLRLLEHDQHTGLAGVYRSAAGELARALASLMDADGRVTFAGFQDDVRFDAVDAELVAASPHAPMDAAAPGGVDPRWSADATELTRRWLYEPTACIAWIQSGSEGGDLAPNALPAEARARIDFRLVPDQQPHRVLELLREHLAASGFADVEVTLHTATPPARSSLETPLARAARRAAVELYDGVEPVRHAVVPGSGPLHLIADGLGIPTVMPPGTIRPGSGMHGPDEKALTEDYIDEVAYTVRLLVLLSIGGSIA